MIQQIGCLRCHERIAIYRGVCPGCRRTQDKQIKAGKVTDEELVERGERAAKQKDRCRMPSGRRWHGWHRRGDEG